MTKAANKIHCVPVNDLRVHVNEDCWCNPRIECEGSLIVHNALDEREKFETGERKVS